MSNIYHHKHHIVPKHLGGTDDPSNLVELTIEGHANTPKKVKEKLVKHEKDISTPKKLKEI